MMLQIMNDPDVLSGMTRESNSSTAPLLTLQSLMPFGKYKGLAIGEIISRDPNYVAWALTNIGSCKLDEQAFKAYKTIRFW